MIKKLLLCLGIGFFTLLGFSSSAFIVRQNGFYSTSTLDSSLDLNVVNKGQLMTQRLGQTKRLLAFQSNDGGKIFFWWALGQKPYYLINKAGYNMQGYLKSYYLCDEFTGDYVFQHCASHTLTDNFSVELGGFFDSLTIDDYWAYDISTWRCYDTQVLINKVCFSSSYYHKSVCFSAGSPAPSGICSCTDCYNLENSLGLSFNSDFTSIGDFVIETPPGFTPVNSGGNISGSSNTSINVGMSGNLLYNNSCTNGYIIGKMKSLYGDSLDSVCYAGTYNTGLIDNDFNGETYIFDYGLNYRELFSLTKNGMSWNQWFSTYEDQINRYKYGRVGVNPFLGQPVALYTYFENLWSNGYLDTPDNYDGGPFAWLNFCNLYLFSDPSEVYSGSYFKPFCEDFNVSDGGGIYITGEIGSVDDGEVLPPGYIPPSNVTSSGVVVSVDWSGVLSGNTNDNFDGKNFINNFYQKLQSVFQKPIGSATGIIPSYILVFLCAIILFRFLRH